MTSLKKWKTNLCWILYHFRQQLCSSEAKRHAVCPEDEVQVDAEDGDEQQRQPAEALQSPSHVLKGDPSGTSRTLNGPPRWGLSRPLKVSRDRDMANVWSTTSFNVICGQNQISEAHSSTSVAPQNPSELEFFRNRASSFQPSFRFDLSAWFQNLTLYKLQFASLNKKCNKGKNLGKISWISKARHLQRRGRSLEDSGEVCGRGFL